MVAKGCYGTWCTLYGMKTFAKSDHQAVFQELIREVLQNEFRYDFRKGPREISAGTVFTCTIAFNAVITILAEILRGPF